MSGSYAADHSRLIERRRQRPAFSDEFQPQRSPPAPMQVPFGHSANTASTAALSSACASGSDDDGCTARGWPPGVGAPCPLPPPPAPIPQPLPPRRHAGVGGHAVTQVHSARPVVDFRSNTSNGLICHCCSLLGSKRFFFRSHERNKSHLNPLSAIPFPPVAEPRPVPAAQRRLALRSLGPHA